MTDKLSCNSATIKLIIILSRGCSFLSWSILSEPESLNVMKIFSTRLKSKLALILLVLVNSCPGSFANENAVIVVDSFHALLLDVMKQGESTSIIERSARLAIAIDSEFDMEIVSNVILNRHWRQLSAEQQSSFTSALLELSAATYASRFSDYNGQQFVSLDYESMNAGRVMVRSQISGPDMDAVALDYILQNVDDRWRIISVIADGVNDLALKRAEYGAIMQSSGIDSLLQEIHAQISTLMTSN